MLIAVLALTIVFGFAVFQALSLTTALRQSRLVTDSVKAFYAADAGVELALYRYFQDKPSTGLTMTNGTDCCFPSTGSNDSTITMNPPLTPEGSLSIKSVGTSPGMSLPSSYRVVRSIETGGW
jgi:Tfp pilus assembly protein PilX